jgi:hypothetical protein
VVAEADQVPSRLEERLRPGVEVRMLAGGHLAAPGDLVAAVDLDRNAGRLQMDGEVDSITLAAGAFDLVLVLNLARSQSRCSTQDGPEELDLGRGWDQSTAAPSAVSRGHSGSRAFDAARSGGPSGH